MPAPHCSVFYRLDALPAAQPTASKHWRHISKTLQHQKYINTVPGKVPCSGTTIQKHSAKRVHEITETSIPSPTETDHDMHHIISSRVAVGQTTWPQILPDSPVLSTPMVQACCVPCRCNVWRISRIKSQKDRMTRFKHLLTSWSQIKCTNLQPSILRPLHRSTCISRHLQLRTGEICWCKVLLPACPCWRQPVHLDYGEDTGVLLNSVSTLSPYPVVTQM